jgi:hypothetical protein
MDAPPTVPMVFGHVYLLRTRADRWILFSPTELR